MKNLPLFAMGVLFLSPPGSLKAAPAEKAVTSGVTYQAIGTYDLDRLNSILTTELGEFTKTSVTYPPAKMAVRLYRVTYPTVIPEKNNRPVRASGLVAIPEHPSARPPMLSYQHGTVFSRDEVPSAPDKSMETRLMLACFAAQGYVVIAADYIGKGASVEPDSYLVKEATAQACFDMLLAARAVLADLQVKPGDLFLAGWSQGSFSTQVFLNRLESVGEPVKAAAVASAPNDLYLCVTRWIQVPSELDVQWLVGTTALLIHSYAEYHGLPGLADAAIRPAYRQAARDLYENKTTWEQAAKVFPASAKELLEDSFVREGALADNRFFQELQNAKAYQWQFKTPTRLYYGKIDEVVTPFMATLPVEYQKTIGGAPCVAVFAGEKANHRGTFAFAAKDLQTWFAEMSSPR